MNYIEHLKLVLLHVIEQFVQRLPVELHRWVGLIEKAPKTLHDAAKFAYEFAILYKPLKMDKFAGSHMQGNSNVAGNTTQNAQNSNQGNKSFNASMIYLVPPSNCQICGLINHHTEQCRKSNSNSHTRGGGKFGWKQQQQGDYGSWPVQLVENSTVQEHVQGLYFQLNETCKPFCTQIRIISRGGTCTNVEALRDLGSLQSLVCCIA